MTPYLDTIRRAKTMIFIARGTSYNAALSVHPLFEQYSRYRICLEVARDFNGRKPVIFRSDCYIFILHTGETANTLISLGYCRKAGDFYVAVCNTTGSSVSRQPDCGIHLNAGVEMELLRLKPIRVRLFVYC